MGGSTLSSVPSFLVLWALASSTPTNVPMILRVVGQDLQNTGAGSAAAISASTLSLSELLRLDAFIASMPCKKGTKSNAVLFTICFLE